MGSKRCGWVRCLSKTRSSRGCHRRRRSSEERPHPVSPNRPRVGAAPPRKSLRLDSDNSGPRRSVPPALSAYPSCEEVLVSALRPWRPCASPAIHLPRRVQPGHMYDDGRRGGWNRHSPMLHLTVPHSLRPAITVTMRTARHTVQDRGVHPRIVLLRARPSAMLRSTSMRPRPRCGNNRRAMASPLHGAGSGHRPRGSRGGTCRRRSRSGA